MGPGALSFHPALQSLALRLHSERSSNIAKNIRECSRQHFMVCFPFKVLNIYLYYLANTKTRPLCANLCNKIISLDHQAPMFSKYLMIMFLTLCYRLCKGHTRMYINKTLVCDKANENRRENNQKEFANGVRSLICG